MIRRDFFKSLIISTPIFGIHSVEKRSVEDSEEKIAKEYIRESVSRDATWLYLARNGENIHTNDWDLWISPKAVGHTFYNHEYGWDTDAEIFYALIKDNFNADKGFGVPKGLHDSFEALLIGLVTKKNVLWRQYDPRPEWGDDRPHKSIAELHRELRTAAYLRKEDT